eukprot:CAMPEP_0113313180 /NCGR_PEP_ID=MMETSP0010_2-20120614/9704_1 /TAXON_ID=216773 ORGANISM="Corethron hystrix, Strain 308" /NCGR_SAMPLE_ID=MMETSP0010_2 /ASSEMBLY_ACC=CAM_ASM_000155 /LENGTH=962 /DNA_ID=CAMNT_0000169135 /DNA_START=422 /DNA_END=3307 /DNA_ORIENTATION=- /assembly_acc=CAM_ASM_000155
MVANGTNRFYRSLLSCLAFFPLFVRVQGQICEDTCPPLNDMGVPIPSMCIGNATLGGDAAKIYKSCSGELASFKLSDFKGSGRVTVVANYYFGCNAGRREAGVYAHVAQRFYDDYGGKVMFVGSNKGAACSTWSTWMKNDAKQLYPGYAKPTNFPVVIDDADAVMRDLYFTPPFGHPSYVILDGDLEVRHKFIGPCCGRINWSDCTANKAKELDQTLTERVEEILAEQEETTTPSHSPSREVSFPTSRPTPTITNPPTSGCEVGSWSQWSPCSITCGGPDSGMKFKWRVVKDNRNHDGNETLPSCPDFVNTKPCTPLEATCGSTCTLETGASYTIKTLVEGLDGPSDVAFHPTPGYHLGTYAEGRSFPEGNLGDGEAWVLNGYNHSISIVSALGTPSQTTFSRRDRGYYHYMINATALSFNRVSDSGRDEDRDSFNYWAVCNDNPNTYLDAKEPNYFMGPTLYNSFPGANNTVNRLGEPCKEYEQCFFMHTDMLHEAPACIGIVHDPETNTAHGNVYWAFDTTGNRENGQLVRFDFQQPHGPGSMDHSVAGVRRYPEVKIHRGPPGVHAGMVVHPTRREVFVAVPGNGTVIVVGADSGEYARIAREEFPIYTNRLPSFDYSIYECVEQRIFASDLDTPSGMALSADGERLFVSEHGSGRIRVYEVASATLLQTIETGFDSIGGIAISPNTNSLYFVDKTTNTLNAVDRSENCYEEYETRVTEGYSSVLDNAVATFENEVGEGVFSLHRDHDCMPEVVIPNITYFEQVHNDTGYAGNSSHTGYEELANRTDCGVTSELNFDALLLGGYYCHTCLPRNEGSMCDSGGECQNIQWAGYTCNNHFFVDSTSLKLYNSSNVEIDSIPKLKPDVTYRFTIMGSEEVYLSESIKKKKPLKIPGEAKDYTITELGDLIFDPSVFKKGKGPYKVYLRTRKKGVEGVKIEIDYPCEDKKLKYDNKAKKNCEW